jgi:hypothetical protein
MAAETLWGGRPSIVSGASFLAAINSRRKKEKILIAFGSSGV